LLVRKRKKYAVTTDSRHWMKKYPNLIRGFDFESPNLLWVSDITYIKYYSNIQLICGIYFIFFIFALPKRRLLWIR
ncbi:hypothetical protein EZS27_021958, partial [termite gut metagenome]